MNQVHVECTSVEATAEEPQPDQVVKLIRKLRWIGMDEEAQKLQRELTLRDAAPADSVVATPGETD